MRCTVCHTKTGFWPGSLSVELCQLCLNDLRQYCKSYGEDVSQRRIETWLRMVRRSG